MNAAILAALLLAPSASQGLNEPDEAILLNAEQAFQQGVNHRNDADRARRLFREAAANYDELWNRGCHNPALALNRARSHRLGGNLPAAIAALHQGLHAAPYDRTLQVQLERARSAVAYPDEELAAQCQTKLPGGIGSRMSPLEAWLLAGFLWLATCLAAARFAMTRASGWRLASAIAAASLLLLGGLWFQDDRRTLNEQRHPIVIIREAVAMKSGNGAAWPDRFKGRISRGAEARELSRRGGWIQIELAGGAIGWIPERNAIVPGEE